MCWVGGQGVDRVVTHENIYGCVLFGLWAGTIIGFITEYYTSHSYEPTREVARSCETGAATNIIYGALPPPMSAPQRASSCDDDDDDDD